MFRIFFQINVQTSRFDFNDWYEVLAPTTRIIAAWMHWKHSSIHLSNHSPIHTIHPSIHNIRPSTIHLTTHPSIYLSFLQSIHPCVHAFTHPSSINPFIRCKRPSSKALNLTAKTVHHRLGNHRGVLKTFDHPWNMNRMNLIPWITLHQATIHAPMHTCNASQIRRPVIIGALIHIRMKQFVFLIPCDSHFNLSIRNV